MSIKHRAARVVKKTLLGYEPQQEHVAIGLPGPQQEIRVMLHGYGAPRDVTQNQSIASLRPLIIAIGFSSDVGERDLQQVHPLLSFWENSTGRELGQVRLRFTRRLVHKTGQIGLFEIIAHINRCLPPLQLQLHSFYRRWEMRRRPAHNFRMAAADLEYSFVYYICPRPVVLVTALWRDAGNMFPMDLLGPLAPDCFVLALRSTSPSVRLMRESGRIALTNIPFEWRETVYELGKQHRQERIDWEQLPFELMPSAEFGMPVPRAALSVRELCVEQVETVGSHTFFVTTAAREQSYAGGLQLFHIHEFYEHHRRQQKRGENAPFARV